MHKEKSPHLKTSRRDIPAILGGLPVFETSSEAPYPKLDTWKQITEEEAQIVYDMTLRNELSGASPTVHEFEQTWRERHQTRFALSLTNGTAALHSAMFGVGVGPGDEVICPTYTWVGSITPALALMATPVFCEVDPKTLLIDVADVRRHITPRTKAIVAVHLWGNVCDMDALIALSQETGIAVIEDCSHAHGASYKGRQCGSIGKVGAWSLQGNKPVSGGEGGMLATNDVSIFERACLLGQVNRSFSAISEARDDELRYPHLPPMGLGIKFRAHPLAIGIASVQLKKLDELNANRRAYIQEISDGLQEIPGVSAVETYEGTESAGFYGLPIRYHAEEMNGLPAPAFAEGLQKEGVLANNNPYPLLVGDGRPLFSGSFPTNSNPCPLLHTLPVFRHGFDMYMHNRCHLCTVNIGEQFKTYAAGDLPITERACSQLIFLPLLTKPVAGATSGILHAIRKVSLHSHLISNI